MAKRRWPLTGPGTITVTFTWMLHPERVEAMLERPKDGLLDISNIWLPPLGSDGWTPPTEAEPVETATIELKFKPAA